VSARTIRDDGAHVIWDGKEGIMLTPAGNGGVIVTTGRYGDHPFDSESRLFDAGAADLIRDSLERLSGRLPG